MHKRKLPETSLEARRSLDPEKIAKMYLRIVEALNAIGSGTYEDIAAHLKEQPVRIWKRMSECNRLGLAHRTGDRKLMKSNRQGFVWAPGPSTETVQREQKVMKGPSVVDHSRKIQEIQKSISQPTLF
jgi:hypothetical protein